MRESVLPQRVAVTVTEARELILGAVEPIGDQTVGLSEAAGRVAAEDVLSGRVIPPADNSAMDGYALCAEDAAKVPAALTVVEELPAGSRSERKIGPGEAARILTGAALPDGADAVVMQERTEREGDRVRVLRSVEPGENVRLAGSDVRPDTPVVTRGDVLGPAAVGMLAAIGRTQVRVASRPRVAILATGDELVEPDRLEDDGRIVTSNSYSLQAALRLAGVEPVYLGIARDEPDEIARAFREALRCDAVISTGGVSVGDRDWIKSVLADLGGEMRLWRVLMKPGAPLAFVVLEGRPVFGLPGNPVSTLVAFEQFVRPALLKMMGCTRLFRPVETAILDAPYRKPADRLHLVRVTLERRDGRLHARATGDQSSGVLLSMVRAAGLAIVPLETTEVPAGSEVPVLRLDRDDLRDEPGY